MGRVAITDLCAAEAFAWGEVDVAGREGQVCGGLVHALRLVRLRPLALECVGQGPVKAPRARRHGIDRLGAPLHAFVRQGEIDAAELEIAAVIENAYTAYRGGVLVVLAQGRGGLVLEVVPNIICGHVGHQGRANAGDHLSPNALHTCEQSASHFIANLLID